jgi:hypothetical protein
MGCLLGGAWTNDGLIGECSIGRGLTGKVSASPGLVGRVGIICTIAEDNYLFVEPADVVWLTPENAFENELSVYSNTDWNII